MPKSKLNVTDKRSGKTVAFGDLDIGEAFTYPEGRAVYIVTAHFLAPMAKASQAFCTEDGRLYDVPSTKQVHRAKVEIVLS